MNGRTSHPVRLTPEDLDAIASAVAGKLQPITDLIITQETTMSAELDALKAQVEQNSQVTQSAITLLNGLADQLRAIANDPAAITALADELQAQDAALSAAVVANTSPNSPPDTPPTP